MSERGPGDPEAQIHCAWRRIQEDTRDGRRQGEGTAVAVTPG